MRLYGIVAFIILWLLRCSVRNRTFSVLSIVEGGKMAKKNCPTRRAVKNIKQNKNLFIAVSKHLS